MMLAGRLDWTSWKKSHGWYTNCKILFSARSEPDQSWIRDVWRSQGELSHDMLREEVSLILLSGLSMSCLKKPKGYLIGATRKGAVLPAPQGISKRKVGYNRAPQLYHALFLMRLIYFSEPVWFCHCLLWINHSWFLNQGKFLQKLVSLSCECMQERKCYF